MVNSACCWSSYSSSPSVSQACTLQTTLKILKQHILYTTFIAAPRPQAPLEASLHTLYIILTILPTSNNEDIHRCFRLYRGSRCTGSSFLWSTK